MASPNTDLFSWNPVVEVSDEEYKFFYSIDRQLISTLIYTLGRDPFDSISVIAFLLWLERTRLGVKAVYRVNLDWPNHLVDMLADQVVALLEWLKNPTLVWEMRGDISLIQELCTQDVGFVYLHERRLEILREKTEIVNEMAEKAFKDMFPNGVVDRSVQDGVGHGSGGAAVVVPREIENRSYGGVQIGSGSAYVRGGGEFAAGLPVYTGDASGNGGGAVYVPQELVNRHLGSAAGLPVAARIPIPVAAVPDPREMSNMSRYVARYGSPAPGLVPGRLIHDSRHLVNSNVGIRVPVPIPIRHPQVVHNGVGYQPAPRIIYQPRPFNSIIHNGPGYAMVRGLVQVRQEPENMEGVGSDDEDGQILPNVPFGPRMGYVEGNPENSGRSQMARTRRAFSEDELAVLLRGLNIREEEPDVHDEDKTVFLTFSRGYPMTEPQIWGFFTRRFGNFIKSIHMEEVQEGVQPLYARMVARNSSILPLICDPDQNVKTRYIINGVHVWAKKYVRRRHTPPPRSSSSAADPPPPPTP